MSGNETVVKVFLRPSHCNEPDSLWVSALWIALRVNSLYERER
jgi:hypothetical protein